MNVVTHKTRNYKAGYVIHYGKWRHSGLWTEMRWAENPNGDFIGDTKEAYRLCNKGGIAPEPSPHTSVCEQEDPNAMRPCSIGFCDREQKWYGWSHRAMYGFGMGAVAKEGDCVVMTGWTDEYIAEHPEDDLSVPVGFEAKTLDDCKRMAIAFAESVG